MRQGWLLWAQQPPEKPLPCHRRRSGSGGLISLTYLPQKWDLFTPQHP